MKVSDLIVVLVIGVVVGLFAFVPGAMDLFKHLNAEHGFIMSFIKFAVLATFGECLALRITVGFYSRRGFGILPRMLVWGVLGIFTKAAFVIFISGAPVLLAQTGFSHFVEAAAFPRFVVSLVTSFMVSVSLNLVFAPVMMTLHKITDTHILQTGGSIRGFFSPIDFAAILKKTDWGVMWNFVYKKTIPFFWIPAHTVTFMLPSEFQVLFAAFLGIMLGLILAIAGNSGSRQPLSTTPA